MPSRYDLATLDWQLAGLAPEQWKFGVSMELGQPLNAEVAAMPATVPGSVQGALRAAGLLPDWNLGLNSRACEWVEHRHWIYQADLPADWTGGDAQARCVLHCEGLDGPGWVLLNGKTVGRFANSFVPHRFDLTAALATGEAPNRLQLVFGLPPQWLGQYGYTSQMTEWKPRFNYTWDWMPRLVQIGIWQGLWLETGRAPRIDTARCRSGWDLDARQGWLTAHASAADAAPGSRWRIRLQDRAGAELAQAESAVSTGELTLALQQLAVAPWWPTGLGEQPLYRASLDLLAPDGIVCDSRDWTVGFKHVAWQDCLGAPAGADPWICVVNGRPVFLQGVNWTPVRPNFADDSAADIHRRVDAYAQIGCNILRVWGGAVLERESFYQRCDEKGLLVWQEFPLSSSGVENWPPEDPRAVADLSAIARSYVARRQHHASLLMWCGGNELQGALDGSKIGIGKPATADHPALAAMARVVQEFDPGRRYMPTSASGPRFMAAAADFGKGLHWDVHGPWRCEGDDLAAHQAYWKADDALLRSEAGAPGASSAAIIRQYAGDQPVVPGSLANPLWRRVSWWIEWPAFQKEKGRVPETLEEYVVWSQKRQSDCLCIAAQACKDRFPRCAGFIIWMGHDSFPCPANTAIIDFHGELKPAARALQQVFRGPSATG